MTEVKPLQPLSSGTILIVGAKTSNFSDDIINNPRVIMWNSQEQHWLNKDLPSNTRAVFMTRFIGHNAYSNVVSQARKRGISIFNPDGTGIIAKQVKELLGIEKTNGQNTETKETQMPFKIKLEPLYSLIDFSKSNVENARVMMARAKELNIQTTLGSLSQLVSNKRRKTNRTAIPKSIQPKMDVSVEMLDNLIKELKDMRSFLIETVEENRKLKAKVNKFKQFFED